MVFHKTIRVFSHLAADIALCATAPEKIDGVAQIAFGMDTVALLMKG